MGQPAKKHQSLVPVVYDTEPQTIVAPTPKAAMVKKLREGADRLERGELWSFRASWREGLNEIQCVEGEGDGTKENPWRVSLRNYKWLEG